MSFFLHLHFAGPQPALRHGPDGGAVQVRVHGCAAPHRDCPSKDDGGEGLLQGVHQHQVLSGRDRSGGRTRRGRSHAGSPP